MKYAIIAAAALVVAVIILVIIKLNDAKKRKKHSQQYVQKLTELHENKNIADCLDEIRDLFKKGSVEYIAVDKAYFYLTQSIMRDYATAFLIIEKVFKDAAVRQLHAQIMEQEKENIMFLLQQPKSE